MSDTDAKVVITLRNVEARVDDCGGCQFCIFDGVGRCSCGLARKAGWVPKDRKILSGGRVKRLPECLRSEPAPLPILVSPTSKKSFRFPS
jgi:hypothetical protein